MPTISVTRLRARSWRFLPLLALHARRTAAQARRADGFLGGAVRAHPDLSFWTLTAWRDDQALRAYVGSGPHRTAMPGLRDWCSEASVARWHAEDPDLPGWPEATRRMREEGRPSALRYPGPHHATLVFAERTGREMRL